ncbi:hypothetical protein [Nocardioides sp. 1609]|uniref:hypothetical protein n=1 Tax=Nocardioides sp. 1609 TaxID=2508327 RepID=UPI00106FA7AC|nr:hypothetical protein [Nocardioides sp. 1609]
MTVLDDGNGAELCLGGVAQSLPPQCGGPGLVGWDWADHAGDFEDVSGTRWGDFVVVGTFDGTDVTPVEVVPADEVDVPDPVEERDPFATPCPEPDGGWVVDPSLATERDVDNAFRVARRLEDYASSFVDLSLDPRTPEEMVQGPPIRGPVPTIVNVSVTSDPQAAEAAIREVWGGGLCLGEASHTQADLARVQRQVGELPGMTSSGSGDDVVDLGVVYDDGSIQAWVDQEYGAGLVRVTGALVDV